MTDQTENPSTTPSAQDDIRIVLQETLIEQVSTLLNFSKTEGFALQIPETDTLILVGRAGKIREFLHQDPCVIQGSGDYSVTFDVPTEPGDYEVTITRRGADAAQPLWDGNGEPWNEAAEKVEQARHAVTRQPVGGLPPLPNPVFKDIAAGGFLSENAYTAKQMEDHARAAIAAHIAGTSQATKAQAEPILLRKKFFDLPLGTRFRYVGGKEEWVVLERHGRGKVAGYQPHDGWVAGQSIFSFADSEEECRALEVDVVLAAPVAKEAPAVLEGFELVPKAFVTEVRRAAEIADSYSPSIDSIDEHGGEECEEPIWQIHHILFYAHAKLFAARKQFAAESVASVAVDATREAESVQEVTQQAAPRSLPNYEVAKLARKYASVVSSVDLDQESRYTFGLADLNKFANAILEGDQA